MKRWLLLLLIGITAVPASAVPGTLRVRLWSQHRLQSILLSAEPTLEVRACSFCAPLRGTRFSIEAKGSRLEVNGSAFRRVFVRGTYVAQADTRSVRLATPLEIAAQNGVVVVTAEMPVEDYVAAGLAGEGGGIRSQEALKALAVAIRTYAMHFRPRHAAEGYDFCDSTHCQDLRLSAVNDRVRTAVAATEGELLWYEGSTIASYYHQDCGGITERGSKDLSTCGRPLPYLKQQNDPWCVRKGTAQWQTTLPKSEIARALRDAGLRTPRNLRTIRVYSRSNSGRVLNVQVSGEFSAFVPADSFYTALGRAFGWSRLRSSMYDISDRGDSLVFTGRGSGHGVGLCQTGASAMGDERQNYREILAFYYPRTQVGINAQGLRWSTLAGDRVDLLTVRQEIDRAVLAHAERLLREAEDRSGMTLHLRPTLRVYPTVAAFRDATGEPGWVAASTRGNVIRLEPFDVLQRTQSADRVLRHEFLHLLVESNSRPDTPLWLREGLVLWLNGDTGRAASASLAPGQIERLLRSPATQHELRTGYAAARTRVSSLVQRYGKAAVVDMLHNGFPSELRGH